MNTRVPFVFVFALAFTSTLTAHAVLAPSSFACSVSFDDLTIPETASGTQMPINGRIYSHRFNDGPPGEGIIDPAGNLVEWEETESGLHEDVRESVPVGGWIEGQYLREVGGEVTDSYLVVAQEDLTPPALEITGWSGVNSVPEAGACGPSVSDSGVWLDLSDAGEPVIYLYEASRERDGEAVSDGSWFRWPGMVPAPPGSELTVEVIAVDLAGNTATASLQEPATSCGGFRGSMTGSDGALGLFALLVAGSCSARRRRSLSPHPPLGPSDSNS